MFDYLFGLGHFIDRFWLKIMAWIGNYIVWDVITHLCPNPASEAHGANMRPIWGRQDPGGPCWPHELCYLSTFYGGLTDILPYIFMLNTRVLKAEQFKKTM